MRFEIMNFSLKSLLVFYTVIPHSRERFFFRTKRGDYSRGVIISNIASALNILFYFPIK